MSDDLTTAELCQLDGKLELKCIDALDGGLDPDTHPVVAALERRANAVSAELASRRAAYESQRTEAQLQREAIERFEHHAFRAYR